MGTDRFVVTLVDAKQGKQEERHWSKAEVVNSMAWLKRMNARGHDVWIRPDGEDGLVLLGGLKKKDVQTLRERGFAPAMVVETGCEQYQAWVKLSQNALTDPLRGRAAEVLVQGLSRYGQCCQPSRWEAGRIYQPAGATVSRTAPVRLGKWMRGQDGAGGIVISCELRTAADEGHDESTRS